MGATGNQHLEVRWPAPPGPDSDVRERLLWYPHIARLAPSKHNTQPWRFVLRGSCLEVWSDAHRALPGSDPRMRELVISCGAAEHHVEVAACALGRVLSVQLLPMGGCNLLARLEESGEVTASEHDAALLDAVARRRTDRGPLDGAVLPPSLAPRLQAAARAAGATLRLVASPDERTALAGLVEQAERLLVGDAAFIAELNAWLRQQGDTRHDGVPTDRTRGPAGSYDAEFVQRDFSGAQGLAAHHREGPDRPLLAVLCTEDDRVLDWLRAGRALSAVLLEAAAAGANASYLNQPLEVPALREKLRTDLQLPGVPQLVLRLGAGDRVAPTPRRGVEVMTKQS